MRITFTGKQEKMAAPQERKLATAFSKLAKLIERKGERAAQVILSSERHLQMAEVRVNVYDQTLIGKGSGADQFNALMEAVENLERRAQKTVEKWRDSKREAPKHKASPAVEGAEFEAPAVASKSDEKKDKKSAKKDKKKAAKAAKRSKPSMVVQAHKSDAKPMTVDEAMLTFESEGDYVVYRDAATDRISVLIRRRDGKVDLVEA